MKFKKTVINMLREQEDILQNYQEMQCDKFRNDETTLDGESKLLIVRWQLQVFCHIFPH